MRVSTPSLLSTPCGRFGKVTGNWQPGHTTIDANPATIHRVETLLRQKIGVLFALFLSADRLLDRWQGSHRVCIKFSLA